MNTPTELYELEKVTDNPLFEGFALEDSPSRLGRDFLDDDLTPGFKVSGSSRNWSQISLRDKWKPPRVIGRVSPFNDFPCVNMVFPAFSIRACEALHDLLEPNGELLPLVSDVGEYFVYNITKIADVLDRDGSECKFWCDPPTTATAIYHFSFFREKLNGLSIFRIPDWPMGTIVTNEFADRVRQHGLNGFHFVKIWPHARGVDWRTEGAKVRRNDSASEQLKRHTMVLMLRLAGKKPDKHEKRSIKKFENELDAQLAVSAINAPFFGWYEGSDTVSNEFRMFLSCPDVDALERKLSPWLQNLDWPTPVFVTKRYGKMNDEDAEEEIIAIRG